MNRSQRKSLAHTDYLEVLICDVANTDACIAGWTQVMWMESSRRGIHFLFMVCGIWARVSKSS